MVFFPSAELFNVSTNRNYKKAPQMENQNIKKRCKLKTIMLDINSKVRSEVGTGSIVQTC